MLAPFHALWSHPRRRDVLLAVLVVAWVVPLFVAFQPGMMSVDSIMQYGMGAGTFPYTNDHPPLLGLMHGLFAKTVGSPWPMLLLQLGSLGFGMAALARSAPPRLSHWAVGVLLLFFLVPTVWAIGNTLWKDVVMAAAMLLAVVAVDRKKPMVALPLAVIAAMVRYNGIAAVIPLAIAAADLSTPSRRPMLRRFGFVCVTGVLVVVASMAANRVVKARYLCMTCQLWAWDLASIYAERPELAERSMFAKELSANDWKTLYRVDSVVPLFNLTPPPGVHRFDLDTMESRRGALFSEWRSVIADNAMLYLEKRLAFCRHFIGADLLPVYYPFHGGLDANPWGFQQRTHTMVFRGLRAVEDATKNSLLFRGWFWLLACVAVTGSALRRYRTRELAFWVGLSGLAFAGTYLVLGLACDLRYLYWTFIATFACALLQLRDAPPIKD